jgi:hypothetical protein
MNTSVSLLFTTSHQPVHRTGLHSLSQTSLSSVIKLVVTIVECLMGHPYQLKPNC